MYTHYAQDPGPCFCGFSDLALVFYVIAGCAVALTLVALIVFAVRPHRLDLLLGRGVSSVAVVLWAVAWLYWRDYHSIYAAHFPVELAPAAPFLPPLRQFANNEPAYVPYVVLVLTVGLLVGVSWRLLWRWRAVTSVRNAGRST